MKQKEISKREIVRCLYKTKKIQAFLRKHKCLSTFIKQIISIDFDLLHDFIIDDNVSETIFVAFTWSETKEGHDYWYNLYKQAVLIK